MKIIHALPVLMLLFFASCQKTISDFDPSVDPTTGNSNNNSGTFEATVNGNKKSFNIISATLLRSTTFNEKRVDIAAVSTDSTIRIILTLAEETPLGNGISAKNYVLNAFPLDDPSTPNIDESLFSQGFTTYSTSLGNNSWYTDIFDEAGTCTITSCDANTKLISGSFQTTLTSMIDTSSIVKITAGKISAIKYTVLN